jgi:TolB-like protein
MSLFEELKRRNVFRVGIAYLVLGWVLLQVTDVVVPILVLPEWVARLVLLLLVLGFPVVLVFAWAFELTPEGIRRERDIDRTQSITPQTGRKLDRVIIVFLAVAVVLLLADRFYEGESVGGHSATEPVHGSSGSPTAPAAPAPPAHGTLPAESTAAESRAKRAPTSGEISVAVLPFVNMSDDASNEYFSDGISEELLNVLVRVEGLRVPSRTSSFSFKGSDKNIAEIGTELKVDHVLEGSVRKAGDRIRVTAQLIDVNTDTHLWSETYTREVDDIFAVQDEIAQAIVSALRVTLSGTEQSSLAQHSTDNVEAYNKYLLGRHLWNRRTRQSLLDGVAPLQEAVALDPQFDQAWAALADSYVLLPEYRAGSILEFIPEARKAAERALAINPDSARALTTQAYIKAMYDYDFAGANADFARAVELEPGYATGHQWFAEILAAQRRTDEALEQIELAIEADPLSPVIAHIKGWILMFTGRTDEALAQYQAARALDPLMPPILNNLETIYLMRGEYASARLLSAELGRILEIDQAPDLALIDAMENPALKAHAVELIQQSPDMYDGAMDRAVSFALLGEYELALDNLEKAFAASDPYAIHMNRVSLYDPLRDNPRFQALLQKMNLWP